MPWTTGQDALRHTHLADTPKRQRQWLHIANGAKASGATDKRAIMEANGVLKRQAETDADAKRKAAPMKAAKRRAPSQPTVQRDMIAKGRFRGLVGQI